MMRLALVTAFPPSSGSLNEYGFHLAEALAARSDVAELVIIADRIAPGQAELDLGPKIRVVRAWSFNALSTSLDILKAVSKENVDGCLFNLQTASFGDREIPAALGLLAPALVRYSGTVSGAVIHNLIDGIELDKTAIGDNRLRASLVSTAGRVITAALLRSNYVTVTLDRLFDILKDRYGAKNAYMVPHGSFSAETASVLPIASRAHEIVTMGKFGTYKRLERLIEAFRMAREKLGDPSIILRIGGTDHPATPGYIDGLKAQHANDPTIRFEGYVAEDDVAEFFGNARLAVFDYESTTGSSGVLHQAAIFGTPPAYPLIGDFIDVTEREGLSGFNYQPHDTSALCGAICEAMSKHEEAESVAENNFALAAGLPLSIIAAFHVGMIRRRIDGRIFSLRHTERIQLAQ